MFKLMDKKNIFNFTLKSGVLINPLLHNNVFDAFEILYVTRHAKRYELGGRRHFEKIRLKVNVASRKIAHLRVFQRSLTYYKTGSKAFFILRFSAGRLSMSRLNVRK